MNPAIQLAKVKASQVGPGWIAFFVVIALCVVTVLLWRSMNHQLRRIKVPPSDRPHRKIQLPQAGGDRPRQDEDNFSEGDQDDPGSGSSRL
ncbi:MAG: hypothetical protein ACRDPG_04345 [Nocardioidaceae bacterium]